jgi:hypothetical protein
MANRTSPSADSDEIFYSDAGVSLCLILNRRARAMRVIDFRSGPHPVKRSVVLGLAARQGVERVYTLVERDECSTWSRMGFVREGSIPGFYKRSDAFLLGGSVPVQEEGFEDSGVRSALSQLDDAAHERLYQSARKIAKQREGIPSGQIKLQPARESDLRKAISAAQRARRALTAFEPFGRDVERLSFVASSRGGFSLHASVETQPCFDNAFLEILIAPRSDKDWLLTSASVRAIAGELLGRGLVSCFALSAVEDIELGAVYVANGFRRTGVLKNHLLIAGRRTDAFLWSRKLAQPGAD